MVRHPLKNLETYPPGLLIDTVIRQKTYQKSVKKHLSSSSLPSFQSQAVKKQQKRQKAAKTAKTAKDSRNSRKQQEAARSSKKQQETVESPVRIKMIFLVENRSRCAKDNFSNVFDEWF